MINDFHDPRLDLRPSRIGNLDVIGNCYEYLIARFASEGGKKGGEFFTPPEVSTLMAKLVNPQPGRRICDPTCGSGSLLVKVAREIRESMGKVSQDFSIFGQETNSGTYALCRMNMFLHGIDSARIVWGDTLNNPKLLENDTLSQFDIVVANPPFSLDKWGADKAANDRFGHFKRGIPPKSKADFAFILHMIETAKPGSGRVAVVIPHGSCSAEPPRELSVASSSRKTCSIVSSACPPTCFSAPASPPPSCFSIKGKNTRTPCSLTPTSI